MRRTTLFALTMCMAAPLYAGVYKWVDENGQVHYGQRPPTASQPATEMNLRKPPPASAEAQERHERMREYLKSTGEERAKREQDRAQADTEEALRQQNCDAAKSRLATYNSGRRIFRVNARGEEYYLNDEERSAQKREAEALVKEWCR